MTDVRPSLVEGVLVLTDRECLFQLYDRVDNPTISEQFATCRFCAL